MDRTEDFRQAVKAEAGRQKLRESAMAKVVASLVMPPAVEPSHFTLDALQALGSVRQLQQLILGCRREYLDQARMTEADRDSVDQQFALMVKKCRQEIDLLQSILTEDGAPNTNIAAHRQGMILILTEQLHTLTKAIDRLRSARLQALTGAHKRQRRRARDLGAGDAKAKPGLGIDASGRRSRMGELFSSSKAAGLLAGGVDGSALGAREGGGASLGRDPGRHNGDGRPGEGEEERMRQQQRVVQDEEILAAELQELQRSSEQLETRMLEISRLNHVFSVNVLQQAEQIEQLYNEAVAATTNIEGGNKELEKALQHGKSNRVIIILFFFVLPMALLFYDWYDRRKGLLW